jgi:hypothetical protein
VKVLLLRVTVIMSASSVEPLVLILTTASVPAV